MEKVEKLSLSRVVNQNIISSMKSSIMMSKGMLILSKKGIDTQIILGKQTKTSHNNQKTLKNFHNKANKYLKTSSTRLSLLDKQQKTKESYYNPKVSTILLNKPKISNKGLGHVKAYSAHSVGNSLTYMNIDINLTKTLMSSKQIIFFGMYEGQHGHTYADYLNKNYHLLLAEQQCLEYNPSQAIKKAKRQLDKKYMLDLKYNDNSTSYISVILIKSNIAYFAYNAVIKSLISQNLGANIIQLSDEELYNKWYKGNQYDHILKRYTLVKQNMQIQVKSIVLDETIDGIILGSERLFDSVKNKEVVQMMWNSLLKNVELKSVHLITGKITKQILIELLTKDSQKNGSLILIVFQNMIQCLSDEDRVRIPYLELQ